MEQLKHQILASIVADPEDYDSREGLWMERENLRAGLARSTRFERRWVEA